MKIHFTRYLIVILLISILAGMVSCMGAPSKSVVEQFLKKTETGDWAGAERMLSERGRLSFVEQSNLRDALWPAIGMAFEAGITPEAVTEAFPRAITVIAADDSTGSSQVRVKINNSIFLGEALTSSVVGRTGLSTIDIIVKFDLVLESNRWKVERINIQTDMIEQEKWKNVAKQSPSTIFGG